MLDSLVCKPIGTYVGDPSEKYMAAKQAELSLQSGGRIVLQAGCNFEQAIADLVGFEHIWVIYWLHRNQSWKPKVNTPRGGPKRSVFATRSPHRPNPIGLSCVELLEINGRELVVGKNDLLDGTPILDIKPYLCYADAFPKSREGWTDNLAPQLAYVVSWSTLAQSQADFIEARCAFPFKSTVELRLRDNPYPQANHRIKPMREGTFVLGLKTWRVEYGIDQQQVTIHQIFTGYDTDTLAGKKLSRWDDVAVHLEFIKHFKI